MRILKADVSHRFSSDKIVALGLQKGYESLYSYGKGDKAVVIKAANLLPLRQNASLVLDVINLKWIMVLEQFNHSPRIARKVRHMDVDSTGRRPLKGYHAFLELENPQRLCFFCGQPTTLAEVSVDHVIPWSFMYSDDLWNLVFVHRACNSKKGNTIPTEEDIERLKVRNTKLLEAIKSDANHNGKRSKIVFELEDALIHDLARRFWLQCMG